MSGDYYANPYSPNYSGYFFDDLDDYEAKIQDYLDEGVEEFEIEYTGSDSNDADLFAALGINQATLELWFDDIEHMNDDEKATLYYIVGDLGYSLDDAVTMLDDDRAFEGTAKEYVEQLSDDVGWNMLLGDNLEFYVDVEKVVRDFEISGDIAEFSFGGRTWVIRPSEF